MTEDEKVNLVVNEYGGIFPPYEVFYLFHLGMNCERFAYAYRDFLELVSDNPDEAMSSLHLALSYAGMVSKMFWPVRKAAITQARAQKLRSSFNVKDDNPLRDRALRNQIEHYDEKLDEYLLTGVVGQIIPFHVGPSFEECSNIKVLMHLDYEGGVFRLFGTSYHYDRINDAMRDIYEKVLEFDGGGGRLSPFNNPVTEG